VVAAYTLTQMPPEKGLRACANLAGLVPPGEMDQGRAGRGRRGSKGGGGCRD